MSHIAVVERITMNRRSISMKISFTRDKSLPVPNDRESIPDRFDLAIRCVKPEVSGHINNMRCSPEIDSIVIDDSMRSIRLNIFNGVPIVRLEVKYSSIYIISHAPDDVVSVNKEM